MRIPLVLALAALTLAPAPGEASCPAPSIRAMPNERRPGDLVLLTGEDWGGSCVDSESCGACGKCTSEEERSVPVREVTILLARAGSDEAEVELTTIELDQTGTFASEVRLPRGLRAGQYVMTAVGEPAGERARGTLRIVR